MFNIIKIIHNKEYIHRDIKPQFYMNEDNKIKIIILD